MLNKENINKTEIENTELPNIVPQYLESSDFLVYTSLGSRRFYAWYNADDSITSLEVILGNWPESTLISYKNIEEFVIEVSWLPYIISGVQDNKLMKLVKTRKE